MKTWIRIDETGASHPPVTTQETLNRITLILTHVSPACPSKPQNRFPHQCCGCEYCYPPDTPFLNMEYPGHTKTSFRSVGGEFCGHSNVTGIECSVVVPQPVLG